MLGQRSQRRGFQEGSMATTVEYCCSPGEMCTRARGMPHALAACVAYLHLAHSCLLNAAVCLPSASTHTSVPFHGNEGSSLAFCARE